LRKEGREIVKEDSEGRKMKEGRKAVKERQ
jgi:hypothetical protein